MRNVLALLWRNNFTIAFLLLQFVSITLLVRFNSFQNSSFLSASNEISGRLFESFTNFTGYLSLGDVNRELAEENAKLKSKTSDAFYSLNPNVTYFNDEAYLKQYEFVTAYVINNSVNKRNNYLLINRGAEHKLRPEMGVIAPNGTVGIIRSVSKNYSLVQSLLHSGTTVSALHNASGYFGLVTWEGGKPDFAQLSDIPSHVDVTIGDTISCRGSSTYFPRTNPIGTVIEVEASGDQGFHEIKIQLNCDMRSISYVYVVRNILKMEQLQLESDTLLSDE